MDHDNCAQDFAYKQQSDISRDDAKDQARAPYKLDRNDHIDEPSRQTDGTEERDSGSNRKRALELPCAINMIPRHKRSSKAA